MFKKPKKQPEVKAEKTIALVKDGKTKFIDRESGLLKVLLKSGWERK